MTKNRSTNRLAKETSPYLRQHAHNPVDWYAWGEEALERARAENKPIFLSIGYSSCHWCHVMERESFENAEIAASMNEKFINIKVDREERPDIDDIYMAATQMLSGHGGWPNSVFLTPDLKPFFAGTYFPPDARMGRPGFGQILQTIGEAWREKRDEVTKVSNEVTERIRDLSKMSLSAEVPAPALLNRAFGDLAGRFDNKEGGFGSAPKFPHSTDISFLLRYHKRTANPEALRMAVISLDKMARGGIYDHLGGGFHRYSVDARWLVPHFEKMLYDNALLARVYLEAARAVAPLPVSPALREGGPATAAFYRSVATETLDWILREMTSPEGGFYSALDADSEGVEGKYYVWKPDEIEEVLGKQEAAMLCGIYGVTSAGNFEDGASILNLRRSIVDEARDLNTDEAEIRLRLAGAKTKLLQAREKRVRPGRDDKALADWNALVISALAEGGRTLREERYLEAARKAARLILDKMRKDGRLLHSYIEGEARHAGLLPDYANTIAALLDLYEATFEPVWVEEARGLATQMIDLFADEKDGGLYLTPKDHEVLIARRRESNDGATPAGASMAAFALPRLAALTGDTNLMKTAEATFRLYRNMIEKFPAAFGHMLCALDQYLGGIREVVIAGRPGDPATFPFLQAFRDDYQPNAVIALADPDDASAAKIVPLLDGKTPRDGKPLAYVCEAGACKAPVATPAEMNQALAAPSSAVPR